MSQLRLCTHIKTNGVKCGSPALRHHTLCYFHYQWQRRDQRRVRLGGPVGMNKNSGIELPLLDGPEAILVSIMEIQHGLLDRRIEIKMGTALLYSLQLALQAKISYFGLCHREPVRECPELDLELEMDRAQAMRPAKEKCARCPKQETCLSARDCRKLPKLPPGIRRQGDHLVRDIPQAIEEYASSSRAESVGAPHLPQSADVGSGVVEGPTFPPPEATALATSSSPETTTPLLRESSPAGNCGENAPPKFPSLRAPHLPQSADVGSPNPRRHIQLGTENRKLRTTTKNEERGTKNQPTDPISYANCILGSNSHPLIDLPGKFPQLAETTRSGK